jgi:bifunctional non-homologous end joining protein LigD
MLTTTTLPRVAPIAPTLKPATFNNPAWLFEPKYDGFRGIVYLTRGSCAIYSKRGNRFSRFRDLEAQLCRLFPRRELILDGEIVAYDGEGRVNFWDLMRRTGTLGYVAFDLLWGGRRDLRVLPLIERKKKLQRLIPEMTGTLSTALTVEELGTELLKAVCIADLEGIVAKRKADPYSDRTPWYKVKNPTYSQAVGRYELFDRRHA